MSRGVNKVILVGTLGADPELRQTNSGSSVCNMRIATNEWRPNATTNEKVEMTEWHSIVLFKRLAEVAEQILKKGSQVYIEGKLRTRKWQDREGNNRYSTEVIANDMQLLGSRRSGSGGYAPENQGNYMPENSKPSGSGSGSGGASMGDDADFDDDIPF